MTFWTFEATASVVDLRNPGSLPPVLIMMIRNTAKTADGNAMRLRLYQGRAALASVLVRVACPVASSGDMLPGDGVVWRSVMCRSRP